MKRRLTQKYEVKHIWKNVMYRHQNLLFSFVRFTRNQSSSNKYFHLTYCELLQVLTFTKMQEYFRLVMNNRSDKLFTINEVFTSFAFALRNRAQLEKFISIDEFERYLRTTICHSILIVIVNLCDLKKILNIRYNDTWDVVEYCAMLIDFFVILKIFENRKRLSIWVFNSVNLLCNLWLSDFCEVIVKSFYSRSINSSKQINSLFSSRINKLFLMNVFLEN